MGSTRKHRLLTLLKLRLPTQPRWRRRAVSGGRSAAGGTAAPSNGCRAGGGAEAQRSMAVNLFDRRTSNAKVKQIYDDGARNGTPAAPPPRRQLRWRAWRSSAW